MKGYQRKGEGQLVSKGQAQRQARQLLLHDPVAVDAALIIQIAQNKRKERSPLCNTSKGRKGVRRYTSPWERFLNPRLGAHLFLSFFSFFPKVHLPCWIRSIHLLFDSPTH